MAQIWSDLPNLLIAWSIQTLGVLSPGPGVALILGVSINRGRCAALRSCLGIAFAALVLAVATVIGLAALLAKIHWAMIVVKYLGAAYLAWLALAALRRATGPEPAAAAAVPGRSASDIAGGFVFQLSNPKAIFFWLAVAAAGSLETVAPISIVIFLCGAVAISFTGHGGWALVFSSAPFTRVYSRIRRWVEGALGVFFAFAAFKLATGRT